MPSTGALDRFPNNLPRQLTSFIGRERELQDLKGLLEHSRLLTLTGPGGSGKTRLGLQFTAEVAGGFPDGVYFVALALALALALAPGSLRAIAMVAIFFPRRLEIAA